MAAEFKALIQHADQARSKATNDQMGSGAVTESSTKKPLEISWLESSSSRDSWQRTLLGEIAWDVSEEASDTWPQIKTRGWQNPRTCAIDFLLSRSILIQRKSTELESNYRPGWL